MGLVARGGPRGYVGGGDSHVLAAPVREEQYWCLGYDFRLSG
jgi:hypothetical protein